MFKYLKALFVSACLITVVLPSTTMAEQLQQTVWYKGEKCKLYESLWFTRDKVYGNFKNHCDTRQRSIEVIVGLYSSRTGLMRRAQGQHHYSFVKETTISRACKPSNQASRFYLNTETSVNGNGFMKWRRQASYRHARTRYCTPS